MKTQTTTNPKGEFRFTFKPEYKHKILRKYHCYGKLELNTIHEGGLTFKPRHKSSNHDTITHGKCQRDF